MTIDRTVSVVIPTWNRANIIENAVRSALAQTLQPLEVLVCDDGSDDTTQNIVENLKYEDPRVIWLPGSHTGLAGVARNKGIKYSTGEWISFLDSDDEWYPDKLEKQIILAERLNCRAVCTNAYRFIPSKGIVGNLITWDKDRITFDDLVKGNSVICSSAVIHKTLFKAVIGFPALKNAQDYALWLRIATKTEFAFVNESLLIYRDDPNNSLRGQGATIFSQQNKVYFDLVKWTMNRADSKKYFVKSAYRLLITFCKSLILQLKKA